jgi:hypothetical protein
MNVTENFRLIGISMLIMAGLVSCGKTEPAWNETERAANPDKFLEHLVSTNATVIGKDTSGNAENQISFSNGNMEYGWVGENPIIIAPILHSVGYGRTGSCVYINAPIIPNKNYDSEIDLCLADRNFDYMGTSYKAGDLYIILASRRGYPRIWTAHVK